MKRIGCRLALAVALCFTALPLGAVVTVGHRGNSMFAPENTTAALVAAAGRADWVEIDIRKSADGAIVLMHDATVDRTTNGSGAVSAMTLAQLRALDAGVKYDSAFGGQRVATLAEAFHAAWSHGLTLLIERKSADISAADLNSLLLALGASDKVVIQSFDWPFCAQIKALNPSLRVGMLGSGTLSATQIARARDANMEFLAWAKAGVTTSTIADIHAAGMKQFVWTVNGLEIQSFYELGVDGIITDDPATAKDVVETSLAAGALGSGLVSYWKLDDALAGGLPALVRDSHGANDGTVLGAPGWLSGAEAVAGGAIELDGSASCVLLPATPTLELATNAMTLSLWVKLDQLPSEQTASYAGILDAVEDSYVLYVDKANGELRAKCSVGALPSGPFSSARPGIPASALDKSRWHSVVFVYDGTYAPLAGMCRIYLDGRLMDLQPGNEGSHPPKGMNGFIKPGQTSAIGRNGSEANGYFKGRVDEVALWKRTLTHAEVRAIYQAGLAGHALDTLITPQSAVADWSAY